MSYEEDVGYSVSGKWLSILLVGISLVFIGIAVLVIISIIQGSSASLGGIILIGPIPIIFGAGPYSAWLIIVSIIVSIISIIFYLIISCKRRSE